MRPPRFTIRQLMIATAIFAGVLWLVLCEPAPGRTPWFVREFSIRSWPGSILGVLIFVYLSWALWHSSRAVCAIDRRGRHAVASIVVGLLAGELLHQRSRALMRQAADHAWYALAYNHSAEGHGGGLWACGPDEGRYYAVPDATTDAQRAQASVFAAYHAGMAKKYAQAARVPWLTIEPDPPPPSLFLPRDSSRQSGE